MKTTFIKMTLTTLAMGVTLSLTACQTMTDKMAEMNVPGFKQEPVAEPRYVPKLIKGAKTTLLIASVKVPCDTVKPMQCMLAKPDNGDADSVFKIPYNWIKGFKAQTNVAYKISVYPLMDANNSNEKTGQWQLDSILLQKPANKNPTNN